MANTELASILKDLQPWSKNTNPICLASTVKLVRNLSGHSFPAKLSSKQRQQVLEVLREEVSKCKGLDQASFFKGQDLGPSDKEFLFEHFLLTQSISQAQKGEGFTLDASGKFLAVFNIQDHLQLQMTDTEGDIEGVFRQLVDVEAAIGREVEYAFNKDFGFLTADPRSCGTAFLAQMFLHVPGLVQTKTLGEALQEVEHPLIESSGLQGEEKNPLGGLLILSNRRSLGVSEEEILKALRTVGTKITVAEEAARSRLGEEKPLASIDLVSRAIGLLQSCHALETFEALENLSLLKLGVSLDWIDGLDIADINRLMFSVRRGHLVNALGEDLSAESLLINRAKVVREIISSTRLNN